MLEIRELIHFLLDIPCPQASILHTASYLIPSGVLKAPGVDGGHIHS